MIGCIFGPQGSGKSYLAEKLFIDRNRPFGIWIDPISESIESNFPHIVRDLFSLHEVLKSFKDTDRARVAYYLENVNDLPGLIRYVQKLRDAIIYADESSYYSNQDEFIKFCRTHRHYQTDVLIVSQRPFRIPRDATQSAAFVAVVGPFREPADVEYLEKLTNGSVPEADSFHNIRVFNGREFDSDPWTNFGIDRDAACEYILHILNGG
ncbi:MAG: ATP-binding protein [Candidatus Omnitrophota bacterium]|jgi:hypothetical protein